MKISTFFKTLNKIFKALNKNKFKFFLAWLLEIFFLIAALGEVFIFVILTTPYVKQALSLIEYQIANASPYEIINLDKILLENPEFKIAFRQILRNIGALILLFLFIFTFTRVLIWSLIKKIFKSEIRFLKLILFSIFWFVIYLIILILAIKSQELFAFKFLKILPFLILVLIANYFSLNSFAGGKLFSFNLKNAIAYFVFTIFIIIFALILMMIKSTYLFVTILILYSIISILTKSFFEFNFKFRK